MANDIKKYPVPLIFKKILKDRLTGLLLISSDNQKKEISFIEGTLDFAKTSLEKERLGQILLSSGKITLHHLDKAIQIQKNTSTSRKIGELLIKITDLTMRDVYNALRQQIKTTAASTFSLTTGEWRFIIEKKRAMEKQRFSIKLAEIIQLGVDKIKEIHYFKRKFYYRAPVTTTIPETTRKFLISPQIKFYANLSTFSDAPVEQILKTINIPEVTFWKNIILLYLLNVVDFVEFTVDVDRNKNIEEINELYEKIQAQNVDYYELFGLKASAAREEIKDTYFKYSQKYHPDRINVAPDSTIMVKANEVFAEINNAYEILSNADKKKEYDIEKYRKNYQPQVSQAESIKNAQNLYFKANALCKQKKFYEAATLLEEAVKINESKANYYLLLGICQSKMPGTKKLAAVNLNKAAQLEPWNADPVFALGELYRSEGMVKKAEECFKKALEINLEHTLAGKAVQDIAKYTTGKKSLFSLFGKKK
ncbi:MAG: DnaJ domain-containing protein [Candidatus Aminicenantes bacterium]|nr:DnaJ domain-containing protein [Candidatus Aminicenantes bacterium]NIM80454.1 DnaJ domain-containing protein [Candidatus Aminicenantes bacterium]NIN19847.1 DnaJ domain-containing protein [Candidatus Aminicenantes bacterium]NIN43723.1 DnaJ domain-containing protein [Candidatus Aminicenantes bacterium]NIN86473.1 DnaJ domain-containing protein [Candidatus Aminicenantes bacterium]